MNTAWAGMELMGQGRATRHQEFQSLVRDVVQDIGTGTERLSHSRRQAPIQPSATAQRAITELADILILPGGAVAGPPSPRTRGPRFLVRTPIAARVEHARYTVRLRRVAVATHRTSVAESLRQNRSARVAVASWLIDPLGVGHLGAGQLLLRPIGVGVATPAAVVAAPVIAEPVAPVPIVLPSEQAAPAEAADDEPATWRSRMGYAANLLIAAAMSIVLLCCAVIIGAFLTGHRLEQVVTGSMQPTVPVGALVVSERIPANQLRAGDVLVFPNPNNTREVIVHRIAQLRADDAGNVIIRTKGDFNADLDNWTVQRPGAALADRVHWVIPGGGAVAEWLRLAGFFGLLGLILGCIVYFGARVVIRILRDEPDAVE